MPADRIPPACTTASPPSFGAPAGPGRVRPRRGPALRLRGARPRAVRAAAAAPLLALALGFGAPQIAGAATASMTTTIFYGDDDFFGIGEAVSEINPTVSRRDGTDSPGTDTQLIGTICGDVACSFPAFRPTDSLPGFSTLGLVTAAAVTLRLGAFDSGPTPFDGPNRLVLDGMEVTGLLSGFSSANTNIVQTRSVALPAAFFPLLADGTVSLLGTRISNDAGSGSFQVDFLSLTVTSQAPPPAVPAPMPGLLLAGALGCLGLGRLRQQRRMRRG